MKNKTLPRSFFFAAAIFSLAAFLFVNVHAGLTVNQVLPAAELAQPKVEEHNDHTIRLPDGTVIGRVLDLAHRLISRTY
jgi:hypothetical protein